MILNRKHLIQAKRSKKIELKKPLKWQKNTKMFIPNCNASFFVEQLLYRIHELQTEKIPHLDITILNTGLDKLNKDKMDDLIKNSSYHFKAVDCENTSIYRKINDIVSRPTFDLHGIIIFINPTILIPPLFIKSMMNVSEMEILKPLNYFLDDNMTRKIKLNEIWKKLWENIMWEIGKLKGIDGIFCWSIHKNDFLKIGGLPERKKINWYEFIDLLKQKKIRNRYFDMRIIKQYSIKFEKIENSNN